MSKYVLTAFCIILLSVAHTLQAQSPGNELINSGEILKQGEKLHDDGKYKEAIALYKKISRSDTNYASALHELALSSYQDSDFNASLQYARLGLKLFPTDASGWYSLIANALDDKEDRTGAIEYYDKMISKNPNGYLGWYNKGVTLYNMENYPGAEKCLRQALLINPYHPTSHYFLGKIYIHNGNLPAAMLCYTTYLALSPGGSRNVAATNALTAIAHVNDEVAEAAGKAHFTSTDNFELQQEILTSKVALDKKYKLQTDVEDPITRQLQVLFEKLEYNAGDTGFAMQFYVPFYKDVLKQGKFNLLVNFMFSGLDIKQVQDFGKRHKKELEDFVNFEVTYFKNIKETRQLMPQARNNAPARYLIEEGVVTGKGNWKMNGNEKQFYGPWEFYYANGQLKAKGAFDDAEKKQGEWVFYYSNGQIKEQSTYVNGKVNGKSTFWFDNGNISEETTYKNGDEDGESTTYYYNGLLKQIVQYSNGKKNGPAKGYKSTGVLNYETAYKDDEEDGAETYYYPAGKVLSQAVYVNGKANGLYKKFADNGTLIMQGTYLQDNPDGAWKEWYPSGKLKLEYTYQNGHINGEEKEYYEDGKTLSVGNYVAGKEEGKHLYFNKDGKLLNESVYENGRLRQLKFYDAKGNVLADNSTRNGVGKFAFYNGYGTKVSEGTFTKDGEKEGTNTGYYDDGKVNYVAEYKKGQLSGIKTTYYYNGNVSEKINYTEGNEDGYYTGYYYNKNPRYEGWFVAGEKQGAFTQYNILGKKTSVSWYKNDIQSGYTEYYNANGKEDYENLYDDGWLTHVTQFDSTGKVLEDVSLPKGNCDFTFYYNTGKPFIKASYRNYHLHGKYTAVYPDGSPYYTKFLKQGLLDSTYTEYFYGGKIESEGRYVNNEKEGQWKIYYNNGRLRYYETYVAGGLQGKSTFYNEDGTKLKEYNYKDNSLDGEVTFYGDSNKVAVVFNYDEGRLLSYTYQGKDGRMVEPIPIPNQTGPVTAYYKNGAKSFVTAYVNGFAEGMRTVYFSNGKVFTEGQRVYGDYQGIQKRYAVNGQLLAEESYNYDNLHGLSTYYYPNGKIKSEENWYNGEANGTSKYYDETGKLKQTRFYYYGQLETVQ